MGIDMRLYGMCTEILICGKSLCCSSSDIWHCVCVSGIDDKGLEEISLKLIKSFLQEKTELEEQYEQVLQLFVWNVCQERWCFSYDYAMFWSVF